MTDTPHLHTFTTFTKSRIMLCSMLSNLECHQVENNTSTALAGPAGRELRERAG